ncbi:MAG: hypothetical protein R3Y16_07445 [Rikenellaceae bacterium]
MREKKRAEELAAKYWDATLTSSEERELMQLLKRMEGEQIIDEDLAALSVIFGGFDDLRGEYDDHKLQSNTKHIAAIIIAVASVAAALFAGLFLHFEGDYEQEEAVYCYINGEPITDMNIALNQMRYLEPMAELSQTITTIESNLNK